MDSQVGGGYKKDGEMSSVDYFLAGKNQGWLVVGASLFASNMKTCVCVCVSIF